LLGGWRFDITRLLCVLRIYMCLLGYAKSCVGNRFPLHLCCLVSLDWGAELDCFVLIPVVIHLCVLVFATSLLR